MLGIVKHYSPPRGSMINALSWRQRTGYASPDRVNFARAHAHAVVVREINDVITISKAVSQTKNVFPSPRTSQDIIDDNSLSSYRFVW